MEDVDANAEYIARDSVDHAAYFVLRLLEATDRLHLFPKSGRIVSEIGNASCREIICGDYRVSG
ncbi:MAG: type II toxin-antitoxin system RelE/ParE family toxin [Syntrophaceae bacterium]|nr:type II toxin-antitoxin system RelE/ParE family toxin [Syntrophaceae bacterium]